MQTDYTKRLYFAAEADTSPYPFVVVTLDMRTYLRRKELTRECTSDSRFDEIIFWAREEMRFYKGKVDGPNWDEYGILFPLDDPYTLGKVGEVHSDDYLDCYQVSYRSGLVQWSALDGDQRIATYEIPWSHLDALFDSLDFVPVATP